MSHGQAVELARGQRIETAPMTDAGYRSVRLLPTLTAAVSRHLQQFCDASGDTLVFTGPLSGGLRRATLYKA